jgi:predicted RNA binding protein YcfA (HicA-like mRNA interferase family)
VLNTRWARKGNDCTVVAFHILYTLAKSVYILLMNSRDIITALQKAGWVHVATVGSHWQFKHPTRSGRVTVPHPKRDLPKGTIRSIEKQSGLTLRERS